MASAHSSGGQARWTGALAAWCLAMSVAGAPQPAAAQRADEVAWQPHWDRVSTLQYVYLSAITATEVFLEYGPIRGRLEPRIHGPWPGDWPVRELLHVDDRSTQRTFDTLDDVLWWTVLGFPIYADAVGAAWLAHGEPGVAWQLTAISLQALLTVTLTARILHVTVRRQRPVYFVAEQAGVEPDTTTSPSLSFPGGHAATSFAGAGLVCSFHQNLPLFGGGLADDMMCPAVLTLATLTAMSRIAIDSHYFSDTLVGAGLGLSVGFFLPQLFHFHEGPGASAFLLPQVGEGEVGVSLQAIF